MIITYIYIIYHIPIFDHLFSIDCIDLSSVIMIIIYIYILIYIYSYSYIYTYIPEYDLYQAISHKYHEVQ